MIDPFPSLDGLVPHQIDVIESLHEFIEKCEGQGMPFEHWCTECTEHYMRALELVARWRKEGSYWYKGQYWCNATPVPKFKRFTITDADLQLGMNT